MDEKRPIPLPGFTVERLDGELLLFHPAQRQILHTNETGALVWQLCDGKRTVADIVGLLTAAYPEAGDEVAADVRAMVTAFVDHGAMTWA